MAGVIYYFEQAKRDAEQELNGCKKRLKPGEIGIHAVGYGVTFERAKCLRLVSLGLLENGTVFPKNNEENSDVTLTAQGRYFANLLLKMGYQTLSKRIMDHGIV